MGVKLTVMLGLLALLLSLSIDYSPVGALPTNPVNKEKDGRLVPFQQGVDCSQAESGEKLPSPTSCSEYYVCVLGIPYLFQCPITVSGRLYFDVELQTCNWPSQADCEITTTNPPTTTTVTEPSNDTTTEEPTTSQTTHTSNIPRNSSTTSRPTSAQPLSTSTTSQNDNLTSNYLPVEAILTNVKLTGSDDESSTSHQDVDCSQADNGEKLPSPTSCSEYYVCVLGIPYLFNCPITVSGRLYFDEELQTCNWPSQVDCEITSTNPPTPTSVTEPSSNTTTEEATTSQTSTPSDYSSTSSNATSPTVVTMKVQPISL